MQVADVAEEPIVEAHGSRARLFRGHAWLIPGLVVVALMLVWAVHDGGYDAETWYWGALVMLGLLAAVVSARWGAIRFSRAATVALVAFALYVAWSYLSISWAASPGDALAGSNRALLYLLVFATMLALPWTARGAMIALLTYVLAIGVVAVVLLVRLASADHVASLVIGGRLAAPTGYFNSTAALFTSGALAAVLLAARRELPGPLRGVLVGFACAGVQLAVIVQSRGWLFTLPLILIAAIVLVPDRLRLAATAIIPAAATLAVVHRLLHVYQASGGAAPDHAANNAGHAALRVCAVAFVVGTVIAWGESLAPKPRPSAGRRRALGSIAVLLAAGATVAGGLAVSHGHPVRFISRQWHGFSHQASVTSGSHFTDVGSGRYDFWRVALDAFAAHPVGGLGQDNFGEYYVSRRHTGEEPSWTHSLEFRLLAHTGAVGFALFAAFLIAAVLAAVPARRSGGLAAAVTAAALLPLVVWLIHGSVDWFWEVPALSGPALGFLGMAAALGGAARFAGAPTPASSRRSRVPGILAGVAGALALLAATAILAFPYLSVREVSMASNIRGVDPGRALADLHTAANLNPLSPDPGRLAGTIALQTGRYGTALQRFAQATSRDPKGWYAWVGAGLAESALGQARRARRDYEVAATIKPGDALIGEAIDRVGTAHPLSAAEALQRLVPD